MADLKITLVKSTIGAVPKHKKTDEDRQDIYITGTHL